MRCGLGGRWRQVVVDEWMEQADESAAGIDTSKAGTETLHEQYLGREVIVFVCLDFVSRVLPR